VLKPGWMRLVQCRKFQQPSDSRVFGKVLGRIVPMSGGLQQR